MTAQEAYNHAILFKELTTIPIPKKESKKEILLVGAINLITKSIYSIALQGGYSLTLLYGKSNKATDSAMEHFEQQGYKVKHGKNETGYTYEISWVHLKDAK